MARKEVDVCDMCESSIAEYEVSKGEDKGLVLCEECVEFWIEDVLEKIEKKMRNSLKEIEG